MVEQRKKNISVKRKLQTLRLSDQNGQRYDVIFRFMQQLDKEESAWARMKEVNFLSKKNYWKLLTSEEFLEGEPRLDPV